MKCIAAVTSDWGIGKDGDLLFSIPDDMKFFRTTTAESTVIMGRATLDSFPGGRPLPRRTNIVLTRDTSFTREGAIVVHDIPAALKAAEDAGNDRIFVIGGESVYRQFLDLCDTAYITKMDIRLPADSFFPNLDREEQWKIAETSPEKEYNGVRYRFVTYTK